MRGARRPTPGRAWPSFLDTVYRSMRLVTSLYGCLYVLNSLLLVSVGALSIWLWLGDAVTIGAVAVVIGLVLRLWGMSQWIMWEVSAPVREHRHGAGRHRLDLAAAPGRGPARARRTSSSTKGEIEFDRIGFHYGKGKGVIEDLSLNVKPGEKVGLVGRSGAGKSTLVNLLLRFYDLESGRILIDGQDISLVTQDSLRAQIGMVTQDTSLLHRSVRDNILYGRPDATEEMMLEAARRAEALDFIAGLADRQGPQGLRRACRRARREAVGRPAPARRDRPRHAQGRADPDPRRGDLGARLRRSRRRSRRTSTG